MIGRADIEGSKSDVTMNAWPPRASYPHGDVSDTSCLKPQRSERSGGPTFMVYIHTENQDQARFCPSASRQVSVLPELTLGHLRYCLTGVPVPRVGVLCTNDFNDVTGDTAAKSEEQADV